VSSLIIQYHVARNQPTPAAQGYWVLPTWKADYIIPCIGVAVKQSWYSTAVVVVLLLRLCVFRALRQPAWSAGATSRDRPGRL